MDELTANYVGEELTHVAALAALPPHLPDTPLDIELPEDQPPAPLFAMSCSLASKLTGRDRPGGAIVNFEWENEKVTAIVENHAVGNVDVLFHCEGEVSNSQHEHKVEVNVGEAIKNLTGALQDMAKFSRECAKKEAPIKIRNAVVHSLFTSEAEEKLASCEEVSQQVKAAMPVKTSPTSLGAAELGSEEKEELSENEVHKFLEEHKL